MESSNVERALNVDDSDETLINNVACEIKSVARRSKIVTSPREGKYESSNREHVDTGSETVDVVFDGLRLSPDPGHAIEEDSAIADGTNKHTQEGTDAEPSVSKTDSQQATADGEVTDPKHTAVDTHKQQAIVHGEVTSSQQFEIIMDSNHAATNDGDETSDCELTDPKHTHDHADIQEAIAEGLETDTHQVGIETDSNQVATNDSEDTDGDENDDDDHAVDEDNDAWYARMFSNELSELSFPLKMTVSPRPTTLDTSSVSSQGNDNSPTSRSHSNNTSPSNNFNDNDSEADRPPSPTAILEKELQDAHDRANNEARKKLALQRRLHALEDLEAARFEVISTPQRKPGVEDSMVSTEARPVWDKDEEHDRCFSCQSFFSFMFNRRHHCRNCGHIFCEQCAPYKNRAPLPRLGFQVPVRHCNDCFGQHSNSLKKSPTASRRKPLIKRMTEGMESISPKNSPKHTHHRTESANLNSETPTGSPPNGISDNRHIFVGSNGYAGEDYGNGYDTVGIGSGPVRRIRSEDGATFNAVRRRQPAAETQQFGSPAPLRRAGKSPSAHDRTTQELIDATRALERSAIAKPTKANVIAVVEHYRFAIEQLSSEEVEEGGNQERANKRTRNALLEMMHNFLEMPTIKRCYSQGHFNGDKKDNDNTNSDTEHNELDRVDEVDELTDDDCVVGVGEGI